jgi:asparagine synthase (glutamine-hydrolysing)
MKIKSRGPEYSAFEILGTKNLTYVGFHRLAIVDLSIHGHQPFKVQRSDGSYFYMICNGEIYEYTKIIQEHNLPTTSSDCEVIALLYQKMTAKANKRTIEDLSTIIDEICRILSSTGSEFAFTVLEYPTSADDIEPLIFAGRDPLGVRPLFYGISENQFGIASEMKGLTDIFDKVYDLPGGSMINYVDRKLQILKYHDLSIYNAVFKHPVNVALADAKRKIVELLTQAVARRLQSDRPIACLLSGGLDSSLIVALTRKILGKSFPVYTIAFADGSEDLPKAKIVANHLGLEHRVLEVTSKEALAMIDPTLYVIESWDITTTRASIMQKMAADRIALNSDIRVILVGENSDELFLGYLYSHYAPTIPDAHQDSVRLVQNVYMYDGRRTDRTMASAGLEVRVPFADTQLVDYVLQLPPEYLVPQVGDNPYGGSIEKSILRDAFLHETIVIDGVEKPLLPPEILYRQKNAFSDAVSLKAKSWYAILQDHFSSFDKESVQDLFISEPFTNESAYYLSKFKEYFSCNGHLSSEKKQIIPYYWMPRWTTTNDPSARTLAILQD